MGPDILGGVSRGVATGNALRQFQRGRQMDELYAQHGPGILAGDQNALRALAQVDPMAAWRITASNRQEQRLEQQHSLEIQRYASTISAQQAAAEAAAIERGVKAGMAAQTPEQWDQIVASLGRDELVGQFENRQAFINQYLGAAEILKQRAGPPAQSSLGKIQADINSGLLPQNTPLRPSLAQSIFGGLGGAAAGGAPVAIPKMGKISDDHVMLPDAAAPGGVRAEVIAGSETDKKERQAEQKAAALEAKQEEQQSQSAGIVLDAIGRIRAKMKRKGPFGGMFDLPEVGIVGSRLAAMSLNQEAVDVEENLKVLQATVAFEKLQRMREASPTGGALGAVSERELALLQSALGALSNRLSPDELGKTLDTVESIMTKFAAYPPEVIAAAGMEGALGSSGAADDLSRQIQAIPDFGAMTNEQLDAYIAEHSK